MEPQRIVVVGGGAVGLGCALFLQADGHEVTLIDRDEPGQGTSLGNAGIISVQTVLPTGTPDVLANLPKLLFDR
ncbi:MAG: FAD-dependent oxidoreductase, partial [Pseudomonadota bacterium]